ncbi:TniQ family protein [Cellulosimicrobium composti]|uniref:TniQ domain-containing protein n=1 Tax=Cellulosimicrobium composti TaxID=2672572 RepID=A0ABX0BC51_9MICO|nr:TniQ family protein [Cellulosimicrobium composti]NDO90135.1 hypothetical protein [Cellulosimicrobium composti]
MTGRLLPVRPEPARGEDLYSLAERIALMNGLHPATLGLTPNTVVRRSVKPEVIDRLAAASGLSRAAAKAMTIEVYPRAVVGRPGKPQPRSWRLPSVRWTCPRCTPRTGIYLRDWQLALHPLCVTCPSLLERPDDPWADAFPPDRRAVATQRRIAETLAMSRTRPWHAQKLRRLYTLITLVAFTADDEWPLLLGWEAEVREALTDRYRDWTQEPPGQPAHAAVLVLECSRALEDRQPRRRLVQEGWERLSGDPALARYAQRFDWNGLLPDIDADGPSSGIPVWDVDAWRRYRDLAHELEDVQERTGLRADHVPAWDLRRGEMFAPSEVDRAQRVEVAVTTHMLLAGPVHNEDTERRSRIALGVTGSGWTTRRLAYGRGVAAQAANEIRQLVGVLVEDGLVDYAERRRHLAEAPRLARRLRSLFQSWNPEASVPLEAVETWLWVAMTHSPPAEGFLLEPALELDRRLDPERRLMLHQAVGEYLKAVTRPDPLVADRRDGAGDVDAASWEVGA